MLSKIGDALGILLLCLLLVIGMTYVAIQVSIAAGGGVTNPKATYKATLYSGGQKIGEWTCDDYNFPDNPRLIKDGKTIATIHGDYVIEPIMEAK